MSEKAEKTEVAEVAKASKSALLSKYADDIKSKDGTETIRTKLLNSWVAKRGENWRRIGLETTLGTFYLFEDRLSGIKVEDSIPESGYDCTMTIGERTYDNEGEEKETLTVYSCKVSPVSSDKLAMIQALSGKGIAVNLFS